MASATRQEWEADLTLRLTVQPPISPSTDPAPADPAPPEPPHAHRIECAIEVVKVADTFDTGRFIFDSTLPPGKEPENRVTPAIAPLVGARFDLLLDADGTIIATRGLESHLARRSPTIRWSSRLLTPEALAANLGPIFTTGATGPRPQGDTWTSRRTEVFGTATLAIDTTITLAAIDPTAADLTWASDAAILPNERVPAGLQRIERALVTGTARWDAGRGWLARSELAADMLVRARPEPDSFLIGRTRLTRLERLD
jgi:hypothetical protein